MFLGVILTCLLSEPQACQLMHGTPQATVSECWQEIEFVGIPYAMEMTGNQVYVAGVTCLELTFLDEPA